jgi:2-amino-4-hydroxy-6-hydroxymethyldihydropteridine diphosphokinase
MTKLYLLLGGNLGDKKRIFAESRRLLEEQIGKIMSLSSIYETEPWGFDSKDNFWNQVLQLDTKLSPEEILEKTKQIELDLGRTRKGDQYDSRIIDIDILFCANQVIKKENLVVPHPRIQDRKFTLVPLNEIASNLVHPVFGKKISQLLEECTDLLKVKLIEDEKS